MSKDDKWPHNIGYVRIWDASSNDWREVPAPPPPHDTRLRRLEEIEDRIARLAILHSQDNEQRFYGLTLMAQIAALYWACDPTCIWADAEELAKVHVAEILKEEGLS